MDEYISAYSEKRGISSKHTISSIKSNLRRVEIIIDKKFKDWKIGDFKDDEKIIDDFVDKYQLNSVIVSISAIKSWLIWNNAPQELIDDYNDIVKDLIKSKDDQVNKQEKSGIEEDLGDDFDWDVLSGKSRKFIEKNIEDANGSKLKNLLILGLFSLQPPTRIGNYLGLEYRKGDGKKLKEDRNYLTEKKNGKYKFIFNKFKTSKYLGKTELSVEDPLLEELLNKYVKTLKGRNPILFNMNSSQISNTLKSITKRFLKTGITLNPFRHSFISNYMKEEHSIEEKTKIAKILGQTYKVPRMEKYARID